MVVLQVKATLENVEEFYTNHPDYNFLLKIKCTNCGENSGKWHDVTESEPISGKHPKIEPHFYAKCKLCSRENYLVIKEKSNGKYTKDDQGKFVKLVEFDCRGLEPIEFKPSKGWIVKAEESGTIWNDVDLSELEWVEYDEKTKQSVGIYDFEHKFTK